MKPSPAVPDDDRFSPAGTAALVALAFAALYYMTATRIFSYDGIAIALDVEFGQPVNLFHTNHLLYSFLGRLAYKLTLLIGPPLRALILLQNLNAIIGGAAVGIFFWVVAKDLGWRRGLIGAALLGFSHVMWVETVDPNLYATSALGACVLLALILRTETLSPLWLGAVHGLIILLHQMFVLVIPAFWLRLKPRQRVPYFGSLAVVVGIPYLWVLARFHSGSPQQMLAWVFGPDGQASSTDVNFLHWWDFNTWKAVSASWLALVHSFFAPLPFVWGALLEHAAAALFVGFLLAASWRYFQGKKPVEDKLGVLWVWILLLSLFLLFYLPGAARFRLLLLPPLIYLAVVWGREIESDRGFRIAALAVALIAVVNFRQVIYPRTQMANSPDLVRSLWISRTLQPDEALLFSGGGPASITNVYVAYFAPHISGRSIHGYFFSNPGGDLTALRGVADAARKAHKRIFVEAALWDPALQAELDTAGGVPAGTVHRWVAAFREQRRLTGPEGYQIVEVR